MTYPSHNVRMRDLIREELAPRVVHRTTTPDGDPAFSCELCGQVTLEDNAHTTILMAKHGTFCKLGNVLGVNE